MKKYLILFTFVLLTFIPFYSIKSFAASNNAPQSFIWYYLNDISQNGLRTWSRLSDGTWSENGSVGFIEIQRHTVNGKNGVLLKRYPTDNGQQFFIPDKNKSMQLLFRQSSQTAWSLLNNMLSISYQSLNTTPNPTNNVSTINAVNASPNTGKTGDSFSFFATLSKPLVSGYTIKIDIGNNVLNKMTGSGTLYSFTQSVYKTGINTYVIGIYDSKGVLTGSKSGTYTVKPMDAASNEQTCSATYQKNFAQCGSGSSLNRACVCNAVNLYKQCTSSPTVSCDANTGVSNANSSKYSEARSDCVSSTVEKNYFLSKGEKYATQYRLTNNCSVPVTVEHCYDGRPSVVSFATTCIKSTDGSNGAWWGGHMGAGDLNPGQSTITVFIPTGAWWIYRACEIPSGKSWVDAESISNTNNYECIVRQ